MDLGRLKTAVVYPGETTVARVSHVAAFPPTIEITSAACVSNVSGISVVGVPGTSTIVLLFFLLLADRTIAYLVIYLLKLSHYRLSELPQECSNSQWHILHL
jgi:hypothetical protein